MTDTNEKEKLPDLKPGHERLKPGVKVFHGARVHKEQIPSSLRALMNATGAAAPKKAATTKTDTGSPKASGPAASDKNK